MPYWGKIFIGVLVCNFVGFIASGVTIEAIPSWYAQLNKPFFNPPNWLFGPIWAILYTLMGISAAGIWEAGFEQQKIKHALSLFGVQLGLNGLWSFIFFGYKSPLMAFIEILFLLSVIAVTFLRFKEIKLWTAWLLVPYFIWVCYAAALNLAIYLLN